jgi:hypothetical protein
LPSFDNKFNKKFIVGSEKTRCRKFDPQSFFLTIVHLVSGRNSEGYFHALSWTWDIFSDLVNAPVKSALTKMRSRISFDFFKSEVDSLLDDYEPHRRTWRGLRVYATDGDQYELPRSKDLLQKGFVGIACKGNKETHYPFLYVTHCYDVLGGVTKAFRWSNRHTEFAFAQEIAADLEQSSLTLYDRYFFCKDLMRSHQKSGSYFVARIKKGGAGILDAMRSFVQGCKQETSFEFEGTTIHLIKLKNPRTKTISLYATNLPRTKFRNDEIGDLYTLRWEVETAHRDLSHTLCMGQWHSKTENGILQEVYASLWIMNQARIAMVKGSTQRLKNMSLLFSYSKSNFKLVCDYLVRNIRHLVEGNIERFLRGLSHIMRISGEKRSRRTRSYPRQTKAARRVYPSASTIPRSK